MRNHRAWLLDLLTVGLPLLILYLLTVSRDIGTIDSGEFALVCDRLGIAHPSGYSLYTLLGHLATRVWPGEPIVAVNLLSVLIAVGAALAVVALARELLAPGAKASVGMAGDPWLPWAAGLWFGTSTVLWSQATGNEVYALHIVFLSLGLRQGVRLMRPDAGPRDLLLPAWIIGLAATHHLSIAFLIPPLILALAIYASRPGALRKRGPASPSAILAAVAFALLGWSIVVYLPIRSAQDPIVDWGDPTRWDTFWRHVLARQYRVWFFESAEQWTANFTLYVRLLPGRLSWPVLVLAAIGAVTWVRRQPRRLVYIALLMITTLVWASSYDIHDLEPYYLPVDLALSILAAAGAGSLVAFLLGSGKARRMIPAAIGGLVILVTGLQAGTHFAHSDRSEDHFVRTHAEMVLRSLPENAVLLSREWDALIAPSYYLQQVEGLRVDVTVIDTELLRRSWYFPQLRRWDPNLLVPLEDRVLAFGEQLALFEKGLPYDFATIEGRYRAVIGGLAHLHRPARPTVLTPEIQLSDYEGTTSVPEGLVIHLFEDPAASQELPPPDVDRLLLSGYRPQDDVHRHVIDVWAEMISMRLRYLKAMTRFAEMPAWEDAFERLAPVVQEQRRAYPE